MSKNGIEARLAALEARVAALEGELERRPTRQEFKQLERLTHYRLEAAESDIALLRERMAKVETQAAAAQPTRTESKMSASCPGPGWYEVVMHEGSIERAVGLRRWRREVPDNAPE